MKNLTQPSVITPGILVLLLLAAAVAFTGITSQKVPVLSSTRLDLLLLVVLGMAICSQGGIGRVAATRQWSHPLSILGYILGGLILIVGVFAFFGWGLPFIQNGQQALLVIAVLAGIKFINAFAHYYLLSQ